MKMAVTLMGRIGFTMWLAVVGLIAFGSMVANPSPFVLMAFTVGGLPAWVVIHSHAVRLVAAFVIGLTVTAVPVLLLVGYGVDEGGVSLIGAVPLAIVLSAIGCTLAWFAMALGRLVWLPWK